MIEEKPEYGRSKLNDKYDKCSINDLTWGLVTLTFLELEADLDVSCECFLVYVAIYNMACGFVAASLPPILASVPKF